MAVSAIIAAFLSAKATYTNDLALFFPKNSLSGKMLAIIQKANLTESLQIEFIANAPDKITDKSDELDKIATQLAQLNNIANVQFRFVPQNASAADELVKIIPYICNANVLDSVNIEDAASGILTALSVPGTPASMLRNDPFNLKRHFLAQLENFREMTGRDISVSHGFLCDENEQKTVMFLSASFSAPPDAKSIGILLSDIHNIIAPHNIQYQIVSPLLHTLENEQALRRDIAVVSVTSIIALLLLFWLVWHRTWCALWIPFLPLVATTLTIGTFSLLLGKIVLLVPGICGGIAGLAVDQGIHVFLNNYGTMRFRRIASLAMPLSLSILTSAVVFLLLCTTGITAYTQLGIFSASVLILNLALSYFLLPGLLHKNTEPRSLSIANWKLSPKLTITIWIFCIIASIALLPRLKTDFSMQALDGTSEHTLQIEHDFQTQWQSSNDTQLTIITADTMDNALRSCEILEKELNTQCFHPAKLWPSSIIRKQNLASWRNADLQSIKNKLGASCVTKGLPPNFFDPFFTHITSSIDTNKDEPPEIISSVLNNTMQTKGNNITAMFFTTAETQELLNIVSHHDNAALISAKAFHYATWSDLQPRIKLLAIWLLPVLLIALFPMLRKPTTLLLVFIPGLTAILCTTGIFALFNIKLGLASIFSFFMLTGLVLDYGIFAVHHAENPQSNTPSALAMSAITTILTTSALLFAKHPVMFHTGLVLASGIFFTSLTAIFIIPVLHKNI